MSYFEGCRKIIQVRDPGIQKIEMKTTLAASRNPVLLQVSELVFILVS